MWIGTKTATRFKTIAEWLRPKLPALKRAASRSHTFLFQPPVLVPVPYK